GGPTGRAGAGPHGSRSRAATGSARYNDGPPRSGTPRRRVSGSRAVSAGAEAVSAGAGRCQREPDGVSGSRAVSAVAEHLRPVRPAVAVVGEPHPDRHEATVEDVGAVPRAVHPARHHVPRGPVTVGDVLPAPALVAGAGRALA